MYADDCILYTSGNDWNRMRYKIQPELDNIHVWCTSNRLRLDIDKSKILVFGSRSKLTKFDYHQHISLGDTPLKLTCKYKYMGVTLDNEMTLTSFLADTKRIVLQKLFSLIKLRYYITEKCALSIYKQTILSIFEFSGFLLISCTKSDRYDLQVMENDALRTCFKVKRCDKLSVLNMHVKANLLSLEQRRTQQLLHLMYMHKRNPVNLIPAARNTRAADREEFHVERYSNCKYKNSPFYKGVELWKLLPLEIVSCDTLFQFKIVLKARYNRYDNTLF